MSFHHRWFSVISFTVKEECHRSTALSSNSGKDDEEMLVGGAQGIESSSRIIIIGTATVESILFVDSIIFVWNMYSNLAKGIYDSLLKKAVLFDKEPILKVVFVYFGLIC